MDYPEDSLIAQIHSQDASNFESSKRRLGLAALLPDDVLKLYHRLAARVNRFETLPDGIY
jgi:hypothetical protein